MRANFLHKENKRDQIEQRLMDRFIAVGCKISTDARRDRQNAKTIAHKPHCIKEVQKTRGKIEKDTLRIIQLSAKMEKSRKDSKSSSALKDFLGREITKLEVEEDLLNNVYELVQKAEKCGDKELAEIAKQRGDWAAATTGLLLASIGVAATVVTASSGQSVCLAIFSGLVGFTVLAAAKTAVVDHQYKTVKKLIDDNKYICNDGPQRPDTVESIVGIYVGARQKIQARLRL